MQAQPFFIDLPFREKRPYLHSASIANTLAARFPGATGLELLMRGWMVHRITFRPLAEGEASAASGHAVITLADGQRLRFEMAEDLAHPATERVRYDEDAVPVVLDEAARRVEVLPLAGYSFFDRLIAANKVVINRCLNPGVKLIAVKIVSPGFPPDDQPFGLRLTAHVGTRMFRSVIEIGGQKQGELQFYGE